jgi:fatty-acyl-CoA synthase
MHDFVSRWASLAPERLAIRDVAHERSLDYRTLDDRASRLATAFAEGWRLERESRVAVLSYDRAEVFELLFACAKSGTTLVPLNYRLAAPELAKILSDAGPSAIFCDQAHEELARELARACGVDTIASIDADYDSLLSLSRPRARPIAMEDVPLVLYTSGTTGTPKGALIAWRQVVFNAINTALALELGPRDRCLACLPLHHTGGLQCLALPLLHAGGSVVLTDGFEPDAAIALLRSGEITTTIAVPTMYQMLADRGFLDGAMRPSAIRSLLCGGAPLSLSLLDRYHEARLPLRQGYGLTEVGPNCFTLSPLDGPHRRGSVGHLAFHSEARLAGGGRDVADGETGELWLRGPHVTKGYLGKPDATAAVLDADGWFHTGDTMRRSADGVYYVVGRIKEMFISGGENVYPGEVEVVLADHPAIAEVAVVAVPDPRWGQVGAAVFTLADNESAPGEEALRGWARARLAAYKVPKRWRAIDALPRTSTGKVAKAALAELFAANHEDAR